MNAPIPAARPPHNHRYAKQSPRGFANEIIIHRFHSKADRDNFVDKHSDDGDVRSALLGATAITAHEAHTLLAYQGDAATESFHTLQDH